MDMTPNYDAISLADRLDLQSILIQTMLGKEYGEKPEAEKHRLAFEWANTYAKKVTVITDNTENKEIRELIFAHEYKKASILIIPLLS